MEDGTWILTAFVDRTIAFWNAGVVLDVPSLMLWCSFKDASFSPVSLRTW